MKDRLALVLLLMCYVSIAVAVITLSACVVKYIGR
jgi:hypothetical protein